MMRRHNNFLIFLVLAIGVFSCGGNKALLQKQSEALRLLGESYYLEGKYTDALAELIKAEQTYSKVPTLHNDLGLVYKAKEKYEKALYHFKKALKLDPHYPEALNNMGTVYSLLGQWDQAIACFDQARSDLLYKTPYIALNNLGLAYYAKKEYDRSVQLYNEALKATPLSAKVYRASIHRGLGRTYMAMGNYKEALLSLEEAITEEPDLAAAYYDLGEVYLRLQSFEKAFSTFEKVLDLSSDPELIAKARAAIQELNR